MNASRIILDFLPSLCQKLSHLVEVWRSYNKNNFACFLRHGVYCSEVQSDLIKFCTLQQTGSIANHITKTQNYTNQYGGRTPYWKIIFLGCYSTTVCPICT